MKRTLLITTLALAGTLFCYAENKIIADAMKKHHKGDTSTCKKIAGGTASETEMAEFIKAYQAMCGQKPAKGDTAAWQAKCKAVIAAVKQIQAKDAAGKDAFDKATDCKACHADFRVKK